MQTCKTLFLFGTFLCVIALVIAQDGGSKKQKGSKKKCNGEDFKSEEAFKGFKECKANATNKETTKEEGSTGGGGGGGKKGKKNMNLCELVCAWKIQGILDDSGKFNKEGAKTYVDKVYPKKFGENALTKIEECNKKHSSKFSTDPECKGYEEFKKCMFKAYKDICGKGKAKGGNKE